MANKSYSTFESFKKYAVSDVKTVEEFLKKYYREDRYTGQGREYAKVLLASHQKSFDEEGFDIISRHDSKTGAVVAFYGPAKSVVAKKKKQGSGNVNT